MIAGAPMTNPEISNPVKVEPPEKKKNINKYIIVKYETFGMEN